MTLPLALSRKKEIAQIVSDAEAELRPKVERIRWEIGQDWTGDWAIFLRVVLSDAVVRKRKAVFVDAYMMATHTSMSPRPHRRPTTPSMVKAQD